MLNITAITFFFIGYLIYLKTRVYIQKDVNMIPY